MEKHLQAIRETQLRLLTKNNEKIKVYYFIDREGIINLSIFRQELLINSYQFPDSKVNLPLMVNVIYGKTFFNSYINVLFKRDDVFKEINCKDTKFDPIVKVIR